MLHKYTHYPLTTHTNDNLIGTPILYAHQMKSVKSDLYIKGTSVFSSVSEGRQALTHTRTLRLTSFGLSNVPFLL